MNLRGKVLWAILGSVLPAAASVSFSTKGRVCCSALRPPLALTLMLVPRSGTRRRPRWGPRPGLRFQCLVTLPERQALGRRSWLPSRLLGSCFWTQVRETLTSHRLVGGSHWLCQYHLPPGVPKSLNTQACTASGPPGADRDTSQPDSEEGRAHTASTCLVPGWATSSGSDPGCRGP